METATWQKLAMVTCIIGIIQPLVLVLSGAVEWLPALLVSVPTFFIGIWFLVFRWKPWKETEG